MNASFKTWVEISRSALRRNVIAIKKVTGRESLFLAVVKGNAYGFGIEPVVKATRSLVDWYGVDSVFEADLTRSLTEKPILIFGYVAPTDAKYAVSRKYSIVISNLEQAKIFSRAATHATPAKLHLKIDTGLSRLGVLPEVAIPLAKQIIKLPNVKLEGALTHFAKLFAQNRTVYETQLRKFSDVLVKLSNIGIRPEITHAASSLAAVVFPETRMKMMRIGIAVYGMWGRNDVKIILDRRHVNLKLSQVLSWRARVVNIKKIPAGTGVGYRHRVVVPKKTTIAVLGAGFYDGIDKRYEKKGYVLINGKKAKMIGSVGMNMCSVDATRVGKIKVGDQATLIGYSKSSMISAYDVANFLDTSTNEVISRINPLTPRILIN